MLSEMTLKRASSRYGRETPVMAIRVPVEVAELTRDNARRHRRPIAAEVTLALELASFLHALVDTAGEPKAERDGRSERLAALRCELEERLGNTVEVLTHEPPPASLMRTIRATTPRSRMS